MKATEEPLLRLTQHLSDRGMINLKRHHTMNELLWSYGRRNRRRNKFAKKALALLKSPRSGDVFVVPRTPKVVVEKIVKAAPHLSLTA